MLVGDCSLKIDTHGGDGREGYGGERGRAAGARGEGVSVFNVQPGDIDMYVIIVEVAGPVDLSPAWVVFEATETPGYGFGGLEALRFG